MMIRCRRFNIYLLVLVALGVVCGCKTQEKPQKKVLASLRLHQEINRDPSGRSEDITVGRDHPVNLVVAKDYHVSEVYVKAAKVVDAMGGFALRVDFDREGSWLLEQLTSANKSRRIAIFSQFFNLGEDKLNSGRWLAAPKIQNHITDGVLVFTPDASQEEAEQIAAGLNNVAKKTRAGKDVKF
jgi:preprotein translocase subunit SecD